MDEKRIQQKLLELASIGQDSLGGVSRTFGSRFMEEGKQAAKAYFEECGMDTWLDSVGNVHGMYVPKGAGNKTVLTGSHLDTVKEGGMFDGLLGVVGAAESVRQLKKDGAQLPYRIHVVATNGEEGNDLGGTFGSRAMMGLIDTLAEGYLETCGRFGFTEQDIKGAELDTKGYEAYLELHIEQGKTLYEKKETIGIVTGIVGLQRYLLEVRGESNHAGTTMMEYRKDAVVEAARVILEADRLAREYGHNMVATIGKLEVHPGEAAVIADRVRMVLEFRNQDERRMERYIRQVDSEAERIGDVRAACLVKKQPVRCSPAIMDCIESACQQEGLTYRRMPSGATHDGNAMAAKMPIGMIFVPSKNGISHSRLEWTQWEDVYRGVEILYRTLKTLGQFLHKGE